MDEIKFIEVESYQSKNSDKSATPNRGGAEVGSSGGGGDEIRFVEEAVPYKNGAIIKVVGVGGAGGNALVNMMEAGIYGVEYIAVNTDMQALNSNPAKTKVLLGKTGLGAGGKPEIGQQSALESIEEIRAVLKGADLVFITCGLGGGTGTGAAPVIALEAKLAGILTVAIVSTPSTFTARKRCEIAEAGLQELVKHVDSFIVVSNDGIQDAGHKLTFSAALKMADDVLRQGVQGIAEIVSKTGHINIDFADVKTALSEKGKSVMGIGRAKGDNRAKQAFENALKSPLLANVSIKGAFAALVNISGNESDIMSDEVYEIHSMLHEQTGDETWIIDGTSYDDRTDNSISVTIIATGIGKKEKVVQMPEMKPIKQSAEEMKERINNIKRTDNKMGIGASDESLYDVPTYLRRQAD